MGESNRSSDSSLNKQRPLSNSFNEISRKSSVSRKEHELHYLKDYTSLTEYELTLLRKTAYTNLRNQFRELNNQLHNNTSNTNLSNATLGNSVNNVSGSNSSLNKNENKNSLLSPDTVNNTTSNTLLPQSKSSVGGSFSNLSYHSHNANVVPGKDFRESVIKNLENIGKVRNNKKWKIFSKKDKKREVFGIPLVTSLEYAFVYIDPSENCSNKKIPIVVYECINFLRKNGLDKEGIFRVNGSERRINNCLKVFNENAGYGFGYDFDGMNVFDVASLLKLYLRQLPEPLIPYCLYTTFLDVIKYIPDDYEKIKAFQYLFMMLPPAHLILLEILLQFLTEIIQHYEKNHMNAHNLACIFAPNLLRSKDSLSSSNLLTLSSSDEYEVALQVIEFLISNKSRFCITSPDVKPFQIFNKFEKDPLQMNVAINAENVNSLSVCDISSFKKNNEALLRIANNNLKKNNKRNSNTLSPTQLEKEIKINGIPSNKNNVAAVAVAVAVAAAAAKEDDSKKKKLETSMDSLNGMQLKNNQISLSTSNMKSEHNTEHNSSEGLNESLMGAKSLGNLNVSQEDNSVNENDADISNKPYHPTVAPITIHNNNNNINNINNNNNNIKNLASSPSSQFNDTYPVTPLSLKCKSNIENARKHSEESFYGINTCPVVSTSLNRLNYLPIKNNDLYEYLERDNDNITPAIANEIAQTPTPTSNKHFDKLKDGPTGSSLTKESISVASFNVDENEKARKDEEVMPSPDIPGKNNDNDQHYPSNVMNLAQKNRENSIISFLSPLSTPDQPIFSVPPPPTTNPPVV